MRCAHLRGDLDSQQ